jgi:peptidoglycan LD-endopeptidase LytH
MKRIVLSVLVVGAISAFGRDLRMLTERAWFIYTLSTEAAPAQLHNPVKSAASRSLVNSWGAARSGGRRHEGIDIFARKDTPVVSTTRGLVTRVGTNTLGGQFVSVLGPGLERHYYAHLNRFGEFRAGDIVHAGDVLGYVGNTGNARGTPPHLHYGIHSRGGAENPYPRLAVLRAAAPSPRT